MVISISLIYSWLYIYLIAAKYYKCYSTVNSSYKQSFWVQRPIDNLISFKSLSKFNPFIYIYPEVLQIIPVSTLIRVVLPAPLCPNKQNSSFEYNYKLKLSIAFFSLKVLIRLDMLMLGF